jgi:hypothetical protein
VASADPLLPELDLREAEAMSGPYLLLHELTTGNLLRHRATALIADTEHAEEIAEALRGRMASVLAAPGLGVTFVFLSDPEGEAWLRECYPPLDVVRRAA